jgi:hypothetical protein
MIISHHPNDVVYLGTTRLAAAWSWLRKEETGDRDSTLSHRLVRPGPAASDSVGMVIDELIVLRVLWDLS